MKKLKRLLIIPARGGSKRIKNKNIKKFKSKPIIFYTIDNAIKSKLFNKIHISTDSYLIKKIVKKKKKQIEFIQKKKITNYKKPLQNFKKSTT